MPNWAELHNAMRGNPVAARDIGNKYLEEFTQSRDEIQQLQAILLIIDANTTLEDHSPLNPLINRGLALAKAQNNFVALAKLNEVLGNIAANASKTEAANQYYDKAMNIAIQHGLEENRADILSDKARLLIQDSRMNSALPLLFDAYGIYEKLKLKWQVSDALTSIADAYSKLGDEATAVQYYERSRQDLTPENDKFSLSVVLYNESASLQALGRVAEAEKLMKQVLQYSLELKDDIGAAYARYRLGIFAQNRGELAEADKQFYAAEKVFENGNNDPMQFLVQLHRAEILTKTNPPAALPALNLARALLDKIKTPEREMQYHQFASKVYKQLGKYRESLDELETWIKAKAANDALFNRKITSELQVKFDAKQKETENALLKSEQQRQDAELVAGKSRRWLLILALAGSLVLLGTLAGVLIYQIKQKRRFADLALHDELTKAPNRRHILSYGQRQLEACRSVGADYCLAVLDLDHFKSINDRFGHDMGDIVLKAFAEACQMGLRKGDRLGRLGGEEWLLVLPTTKLDELQSIFKRLRAAVQVYRPASLPEGTLITFSMGAAKAEPDESFERLLQRADEAMYAAKVAGRDRLSLGPAASPSAS